ncbi:ATP-binding protein [Streptomyces sp. NPDC051740]|uniref:ATP-binding protein n=1 Tax=Streptomyces sp. NPDC051740 TaxID=3365673 RepID=UPI00378BD8CE
MNAETAASVRPFTVLLSPTTRGARLARRLVVSQILGWGIPHAEPVIEDAGAVTSELAANAIAHGRTTGRDFRLTLTLVPATGRLRIAVSDIRPDRLPPCPGTLGTPPPEAEGGRGLLLVEALAADWGWTADDPVIKTVWAELDLTPA